MIGLVTIEMRISVVALLEVVSLACFVRSVVQSKEVVLRYSLKATEEILTSIENPDGLWFRIGDIAVCSLQL